MVLRISERCDLGIWARNEGFSGVIESFFSTTLRNSHTFFAFEFLETVVSFSPAIHTPWPQISLRFPIIIYELKLDGLVLYIILTLITSPVSVLDDGGPVID
jgi:hypothetical protein